VLIISLDNWYLQTLKVDVTSLATTAKAQSSLLYVEEISIPKPQAEAKSPAVLLITLAEPPT
jgi:hypothetical protein